MAMFFSGFRRRAAIACAAMGLLFISTPVAEPSLLALSDSIDALDLPIRRASDDSSRAVLFAHQRELMARADSVRHAVEGTQHAASPIVGDAGAEHAPHLQSLQSPNPIQQQKKRWFFIALGVFSLCTGVGLMLRAKFRPRRVQRSAAPLHTEDLVIVPPTPRPKRVKDHKRVLRLATLAQDDSDLQNDVPRDASLSPSVTLREGATTGDPATDADGPRRMTAQADDVEEPLFLSPTALTRLEQEDRTRGDILKLTRRGYTGSEIARRLRLPAEQVEEVIRTARIKGE